MKISCITIPGFLSLVGLTLAGGMPAQAQSNCASVPNAQGTSCADIYSATPDRVRLNLGQREVPINTSSPETVSTFTNSAPTATTLRKDPTDFSAFNVLTTASYARADLQLSDGSLVWTKPYTQVGLASGNRCSVSNLYEAQPGQPSPILCLRSGSILVVTPPNKSRVTVVTDEGMIFTPGTVYLVNRDAAAKRTEVFVFSGSGAARVIPPNDMGCAAPGAGLPGVRIQPMGQECRFRIEPGQYVTVTSDMLSLPKPFDLPAWVATDPFFAPLRGDANWEGVGELNTQSVNPANNIATLRTDMPMKLVQGTGSGAVPSSVIQSINAAQPGVLESVGLQSTDCPLNVAEVPSGAAPGAANFLPPPVLPPKPAPVIPPPMPAPRRPIRGLW